MHGHSRTIWLGIVEWSCQLKGKEQVPVNIYLTNCVCTQNNNKQLQALDVLSNAEHI